jgi:hypothetical protein
MPPFVHILAPVKGRDAPPEAFLRELVAWGRQAPADIFAPNDEPGDVMSKLCGILGPWDGVAGTAGYMLHRKCAMLELLRCLAGFESSWHWNEGVDTTNHRSLAHPECEEAGAFQESFDSVANEHHHHTLKDFLHAHGVFDAASFIAQSKANHDFELEYTARLLRITYRCNGPIVRGEIDSSLSRAAVDEFKTLMA